MENKYFKKIPLILACSYTGVMGFAAFIDPQSRQHLGPRERLSQWADMFRGALYPMVAFSALTSIAGFLQYYETKNINWAIGGGFIASILPFTNFIIKPVYTRLLEADKKGDTKDTDQDISTWLGLHKFRVLLAAIATAFFVYAELQDEIPKLVIKA